MTRFQMKARCAGLVAAGILLSSGDVFADEWGKIIDLNDRAVYVRFPTPTVSQGSIRIWSLQDFRTRQVTAGKNWRSLIKLETYDCVNERVTTNEMIFYAQQMGAGQPIQRLTVNETANVVPGTMGASMFKSACAG